MAKSPNTIHRSRFLKRAPRILAIIFILFLTMFGLDMFGGEESIRIQIGGFLMHSIPSIILVIVLIISWKHELVGAIVFGLMGLLYIITTSISQIDWYIKISWSLTIAGPALLTGILFFISRRKKRLQSGQGKNNK